MKMVLNQNVKNNQSVDKIKKETDALLNNRNNIYTYLLVIILIFLFIKIIVDICFFLRTILFSQ